MSPRLGQRCGAFARSSAFEEKLSLACVARERRRTFELYVRFVKAVQLEQEVAAYAWQEVVALE